MTAYYNEIDPFAAQWLRNLIDAGHIAPGVVDIRSIEEVTANDLKGFTQCHFFAGFGTWSLALRRAGWSDSRPVWTASCPCQPFSAAGKGLGFADERHLWPALHWLVGECEPVALLGEQSASADANHWIDLVQADVEALGYAFGAIAFPSASVGAPHIRDRAYWVADANGERMDTSKQCGQTGRVEFANSGYIGGVGHTECQRQQTRRNGHHRGYVGHQSGSVGKNGRLAHTYDEQRQVALRFRSYEHLSAEWNKNSEAAAGCSSNSRPGPVNGFWRNADWLFCRDGKYRAVEPGLSPLVNGAATRVGRLRAYGNAINVEAATVFIKAYMMGAANV